MIPLVALALAAPSTDTSLHLVGLDGVRVGVSGSVGVTGLQTWAWKGPFELGVRESFRTVSGPFVSTQLQGAVGVRIGRSELPVEAGYYLLAGGWLGATWGRAHYPDLEVDQSYRSVAVRPATGAVLTSRVWLSEGFGLCLDAYVPAWPWFEPLHDGHTGLVSIGLSTR